MDADETTDVGVSGREGGREDKREEGREAEDGALIEAETTAFFSGVDRDDWRKTGAGDGTESEPTFSDLIFLRIIG